jgi:hypothetical protein
MSRLALVLEVGERHLEATGGKPDRPQIGPAALGVRRGAINKKDDVPPKLGRQKAFRNELDFEVAQLLDLFDNLKPNADDADPDDASSSRAASPVTIPDEVVDEERWKVNENPYYGAPKTAR